MEAEERTSLAVQGASPSQSPETALIAAQDAAQLQSSIAALPISYREVFVLREAQALSYREIAAVSGLPLGTVMSRLARARDLLVAALSGNTG